MMQLGKCSKCGYKSESEASICSFKGCPLMIDESPFTFPFSDGRRPVIEDKNDTKD